MKVTDKMVEAALRAYHVEEPHRGTWWGHVEIGHMHRALENALAAADPIESLAAASDDALEAAVESLSPSQRHTLRRTLAYDPPMKPTGSDRLTPEEREWRDEFGYPGDWQHDNLFEPAMIQALAIIDRLAPKKENADG